MLGSKLRRAEWGKENFIELVPGGSFKTGPTITLPISSTVTYGPIIRLNGTMNWDIVQDDILATDWEILIS